VTHRFLQALPNHAIFGDYTEGALLDLFDYYGPYLETESISESRIRFSLVDEGIFLQSEGIAEPGAEIVQTNLFGCGGPVHIIDHAGVNVVHCCATSMWGSGPDVDLMHVQLQNSPSFLAVTIFGAAVRKPCHKVMRMKVIHPCSRLGPKG